MTQTMNSADNTDRLVDWLIDSIELEAAAFHVGQYCGRWRASTAGRDLGSFHIVLHGSCWLHVEGRAPLRLGPRDGVFLLRDVPHFLSPDPDPAAPMPSAPMLPLSAPSDGTTGLACGFFQFRGNGLLTPFTRAERWWAAWTAHRRAPLQAVNPPAA